MTQKTPEYIIVNVELTRTFLTLVSKSMVVKTTTSIVTLESMGKVINQNSCHFDAPSICDTSYSDLGID